jgi:hypothetical protein
MHKFCNVPTHFHAIIPFIIDHELMFHTTLLLLHMTSGAHELT